MFTKTKLPLLSLLLSVFLFSCSRSSDGYAPSITTPDSTTPSSLAISPTVDTLAVTNIKVFTASGGTPPYLYTLFSGAGSITSTTGNFVAPGVAGSTVVRVTDQLGQFADAIVTINSAIAISPANTSLGLNATQAFTVSGGVLPYTYSLVSGSGSVNSSSGVYTAPASSTTAIVRVQDSIGNIAESTVSVFSALGISPATYSIAINNTTTFSAGGGQAPYTFSVSGGGSINATTGVYTAPASSGTVTVTVTDNLGSTANSLVTINPALAISPTSQTVLVNSTVTLSASGGVTPYTFSIVSGTGSMNSTTGDYATPASNGSATVRVTDNVGNTANAIVTITSAMSISPASITLAVNNTTTFTVSGGTGPYTYSTVSGTGTINSSTGVYTAPASSGSATVRVTDSLSVTADASVTINPALAITPSTKVLAVNNTFAFSANNGVSPYTFSIVSGGGSIDSSSGLYTAPATAGSVTVRVTDGRGNTSNSAVTINAALAISPSSATISSTGTQAYSATGGVSPFIYSIVSGPGSINSSSGLYTGASVGSVTVRVTDSLSNTSDGMLTVNGQLSVSPVTAYVVIDSDLSLTAVGGVSPYTYSIVTGGGVIDTVTGIYTAPATTGSATLRTTDSATPTAATVDTTVTIYNALTLSPTSLTMAVNGTTTFMASGGVGARTFSIYSGSGTINSSTGAYIAPAVAGTDLVHVTDTIGNVVEATVTVVSQLSITPSSLKLPVFSIVTFSAVLGSSPYTYSVFAGTGSINSSTGFYTAASTASVGTVRVTDSLLNTSDAAITHIEPVQISSGSNHSCVRYSEGSVKCFGLGSSGQLGNGATTNLGDTASTLGGKIPFINLGTGRIATSIATGFVHSCALLDNATVKCWGQNTYGQLGIGNTTSMGSAANQMGNSLPAINLGTGRTATNIFAMGYSTCAILDNSTTKCWGRNSSGQLGKDDIVNRGTSASQMGDSLTAINLGSGRTAIKLVGGLDFMCALLDNATVKCFGGNRYGQLGQGSTTNLGDNAGEMAALTAISLGTGRTAVDIGAGYSHACAILDNGTAKCWGRNNKGQVAVESSSNTIGASAGQMGDSLLACPFSGFTPTKVSGGNTDTCFMNAAGNVRCFGLGTNGQLLLGSTSNIGRTNNDVASSVNVNMGTGVTATSLSVGFYTNCVITNSKRIKCWGSSLSGATGNGQTANNLGDIAGELGDSLPFVNH